MAFRTTDILIWASQPGRVPTWSAREPVMRIRRGRPDSGETAVFLLNGLLLAVGLQLEQRKRWLQHSAGVPLMFFGAGEEETKMDGNYVFLCGVMWCRFGQQDAGKELLRAADSGDRDMEALAWAMFAKGVRRLKELEKRMQPSSRAILGEELCGRDPGLPVRRFCTS